MADSLGYNDMMRMQSEAVRRVQEMQRRAQNVVQRANAPRAGRAQEIPESKGESLKQGAPPISASHTRSTALPLNIPSPRRPSASHNPPEPHEVSSTDQSRSPQLFTGDADRLLVIVLILLLSQEEADDLLLMALGYLIM